MDILAGMLCGQLSARSRHQGIMIAVGEMRRTLIGLLAGLALVGGIVASLSWSADGSHRSSVGAAEAAQAAHG